MIVFFDTSVLVAALLKQHSKHAVAVSWLSRARSGEFTWCLAAHSLAELYSTLTRLPLPDRQSPEIAAKLIETNITAGGASAIALTSEEYLQTIRNMSESGVGGGATYDALIAFAAQKGKADKLLTFNPVHFKRVWTEGGERIQVP